MTEEESTYGDAITRILDGIHQAQHNQTQAENELRRIDRNEIQRLNTLKTREEELGADLEVLKGEDDYIDPVQHYEDIDSQQEADAEAREIQDELDEVEAEAETITDNQQVSKFDRRRQRVEERRQEAQKTGVRRRRKLESLVERSPESPGFEDEDAFDSHIQDLIEDHDWSPEDGEDSDESDSEGN